MERGLKYHVAQLAREYLEGRLHHHDFFAAIDKIPGLHDDEDVSALIDLVYHGPALTIGWGKRMKARHDEEVAQHEQEVSQLIDRLLAS